MSSPWQSPPENLAENSPPLVYDFDSQDMWVHACVITRGLEAHMGRDPFGSLPFFLGSDPGQILEAFLGTNKKEQNERLLNRIKLYWTAASDEFLIIPETWQESVVF